MLGDFLKTFLEGSVDHVIHKDYNYSESALLYLLWSGPWTSKHGREPHFLDSSKH